MARTIRKTGRDGKETYEGGNVRPWYRRENKPARKATNRQNRQAVAHMLRNRAVDYEGVLIPLPPRTEGWMAH